MEPRQMFAAHIVGNPTSYATIQAAVNAALPGSTINVDAGTYNETVLVNESLTIRGAQAGVDARNTRGAESIVYATQTVFKITANDVTIDGFTIEGDDADIGSLQGAGVLMAPSIHGTHVINNIIQNNVTGIYLSNNSNTDEAIIQHNLIQNNFEANNNWQTKQENGSREIYTDGTVSGGYLTNVLIDSNTIGNFNFNGGDEDEGLIALQALTAGKQFNIAITNNFITDGSKALLATNVTNLVFMGNTITGLQDASSGPVRFEGDANNIDIQYNTIYGNVGPGVASDDSGVPGDNSGFVVDNNNIYNNDGIGVITVASLYDGILYAQNDWWGSTTGPGGDGPGTGQAVWANGVTGHYLTPTGTAGGYSNFTPWATALINITAIPAPAADSGLTVSPAGAGQLALNWTAPSSTATSQIIQRSTDGVNFNTLAVVPALLNTYTDTGLTTGVSYSYRVITSNSTGNGAASNTAVGTPPVYQLPEPVNGVSATSTTSNSISLQWNIPSYPYGITNYTIYRNGTAIGTSATTSYTDTGLAADTAYNYTITTTDTSAAVSNPSAAVSLVTAHSQFQDPSFESTSVNSTYAYAPITANWTFTGNAGIEGNGSTFLAANAPGGTQAAFIQGVNGGVGSISQQMTITTTGAYSLSFQAAQRTGYGVQPVTVSLDGTLIGTYSPTSSAFTSYTTSAFALYAGTHTFTFTGTKNTGDCDSFIDLVSLNLAGNATVPSKPLLTSVGAASASSTDLTWAPGGFGATAFSVLRSTNGVNWSTIASGISSSTNAYTDTGLSASTTYYYEVYASDPIGSSAASNVMSVTTLSSVAVITPISSLTWTSATSGYKTVQQNASVQGNTLTLHGSNYSTGLGTSAVSVITYNLAGSYTTFTTDVGIDGEENTPGAVVASVDFQVLGDGKVLYDSGDLTTSSPTVHIAVPVTGVQTLTLVATNGIPGIADDHADWAGAELYTNPQAPLTPTALTAVANSASAIGLTWSAPTGGFAPTGYIVQRSTDGVNFSTVVTLGAVGTYTDTSVAAATTYIYRVVATNANGTSVPSATASATTLAAGGVVTNLTSLNWVSATAGYGSVQTNQSVNGNPITLKGVVYPSGLSANAVSNIVYNLSGNYTNFLATIGIDDEELTKGTGSVDFQVIGDGKTLYDSGVLTNASPAVNINVSVVGVQTLTLVANNGVAGTINYDHADWAGARLLTSAAQALVAPSNTTAVATSSNQINLRWNSTAVNATGFVIQRSNDGINFTTIATLVSASNTTYSDTTASASTTYYYQVLATGSGLTSSASNIASATTLPASTITTNLSSLAWTSATAGYGSVQQNQSVNGNPITLKGVVYPSGLSANAVSTIVYNIGGAYTNFLATIGIDDEELTKGTGSVDFQVIGDGKTLYDSGVLTNSSPAVTIDVPITGVQTLTLVANNGIPNNIDYDHADWAAARLISIPTAPASPASLTATAISTTTVSLVWAETSTSVTSFTVQRSTDGVSFTTIGTTAGNVLTYTDSTGAASTKYYYQIMATGSGFTSKPSVIASATTLSASSISTNLSSLNWVSATAGYSSVQKNTSILGNPITLKGVVYASGIGTHASSTIVYNVAGGYTNFLATVGIDDEELAKGSGSVDFQVLGDGKVLFDSGVLTSASAAVNINVSLVGVQTLTLIANNGIPNNIDYDHADWAGARLLSTPQSPAAPTTLTAVTTSASQINLSWTAPVGTAATGYLVQRSTDGINFATVATLGTVNSYFDNTGLSAGVTYTYQIVATNSIGNSSPSAIATATTLSASAIVTNLGSLPWVSATTGYGNVQTNSSVSGNTITLRGVTYTTGIGAHAVSNIVYNLNGAYTNFISDVGVDDEENGKGIGSVDFQVIGDGKVLFDSGVLTNNSSIVSLNVNVTGVQQLTLLATNGVANSIDYDHADWAGARLVAAPAAPAAMVAAELAPKSSISSVAIVDLATATESTWSNTLIGNVGQIGSATETGSSITINGAGAGIAGKADAADYAYESLAGDGTIVAHLDTAQTGTGEAGIMIRESLDAGAKEVALVLGQKTVKLVQRAKTDGTAKTAVTKIKANAVTPSWVKLVRKGNTFTAYDSVDGVHWKKVGATTIKMNASVDIGLAGASGTTSSLSSAVFSNVAVTEAGPTIQATDAKKKKK